MSFENPVWLAVTPLMVLTIAGLVAFGLRRRDALICQFVAARLLNQLTEKVSLKRSLIKAGLILLAVALIGIALARPQYGIDFVERKARGLDIVFVLDSSRSMLATDLRPTRLDRAKLAIADLVKRLESDRIGLVVFSGNAFLQTPPTLDYSAFRENLNAVGTGSISRGGSNIGQALREAAKAFAKDDNFKVVVLLTDGEDLEEQAIDTAREIAEEGIRVYSIGIGTPEGIYLKVRSEDGIEEYVRDSSGQPVRSRLDETTLRKISKLTGGSYSRLAGQSLEMLYTSVLATLPRQERESELQESRVERYQWLLCAAAICLIMELLIQRRRRIITHSVTLFLCLHLITPAPSSADEIDLLADQPAEEATAENPYTDPRMIYNQAHESMLKGNYAEARDLYERAIQNSDDITLERNGLYNMAHAMNQMGEEALQSQDFQTAVDYWKQAEELFKSANELDPDDVDSLEDAERMEDRRKALEDFLDQQQSQEQEQPTDENSDDQDPQDSETDSSENESDGSESSSEENSEDSSNTESSERSSEQEPSDNQKEDNANQSSSDTKNDEGDASEQNEDSTESSENADSEETTNDSSPESSKDPTEDMQEPDETTGSGENKDSSESEKDAVKQSNSADTNGTAEGQETVTVSEGMQLLEAQALLNSLRNDEQLLPFTGSAEEQGQSRKERDW